LPPSQPVSLTFSIKLDDAQAFGEEDLKRVLLFFAAMLTGSAVANGTEPELVARSSHSLWPEPIDSPAAFDRASRAEILVLAAALKDAAGQDEAALKKQFNIEHADTASVQKVTNRLSGVLLDNYRVARASCGVGDILCDPIASKDALSAVGAAIADKLAGKFQPWYAEAREFHKIYAAELVRLAALFPTISSEIDAYSRVESDGSEMNDKNFLFTFDDGPTERGGQTDILLQILNEKGIHAVFYLIGEQLDTRLKQDGAPALNQLYGGQCTALHGWRHLSHATWAEWQSSVIRSRNIVQNTFPNEYRPWFRPPFGERLSDSGPFFTQNGLSVVLWNINSQDWNEFMTADEVAQRISKLMLLWRRGIILLHDTHPNAAAAVPWLIDRYRTAGVVWEDCRNIPRPAGLGR
jgi:peptidoglycan/xylan/chitin deacetylase (PgdA/CDA1 family)